MSDPGQPPQVTVREFRGAEEASGALAADVALQLAAALECQARVTLVVSGGRTPREFLNQLSRLPLAWRRVDVLPADERCVASDSEQRNSRLVREHLCRNQAGQARLHELGSAVPADPDTEARLASTRLADLHWPASAVVLGMGQDGHTASLFPDAPELAVAMEGDPGQRVVAMRPPSQPQPRLTLTSALLLGAALTVLHLQGNGKRLALKEAFRQPDDVPAMPIRLFFRQPLRVYWSP